MLPRPGRGPRRVPYYYEYLRPKRPGGRGFVVSRDAFEAGTSRDGAIMIGSAGEVTGKLLAGSGALRLDRIFAQVDWAACRRARAGFHCPVRRRDRPGAARYLSDV